MAGAVAGDPTAAGLVPVLIYRGRRSDRGQKSGRVPAAVPDTKIFPVVLIGRQTAGSPDFPSLPEKTGEGGETFFLNRPGKSGFFLSSGYVPG